PPSRDASRIPRRVLDERRRRGRPLPRHDRAHQPRPGGSVPRPLPLRGQLRRARRSPDAPRTGRAAAALPRRAQAHEPVLPPGGRAPLLGLPRRRRAAGSQRRKPSSPLAVRDAAERDLRREHHADLSGGSWYQLQRSPGTRRRESDLRAPRLASETMRLGVIVSPAAGFSYDEIRELATKAEASGFNSFWVSDHFFGGPGGIPDRNCLEAWTLLAALARDTQRIRLGVLVAAVQYRNPALQAKIAAGADNISGGRLEFGIGAGWKEAEYRAYGPDFTATAQAPEHPKAAPGI